MAGGGERGWDGVRARLGDVRPQFLLGEEAWKRKVEGSMGEKRKWVDYRCLW